MKQFLISKTTYVNSIKCHKKAWLHKYKNHLKEPISLAGQLNIEDGHQIGNLALKFIDSKGVLIKTFNKEQALEDTRKEIANQTEHIYEASFLYKNQYVQVDILKNNFDGTFDIIEVKSANNIKEHHYIDIGFQKYVVERCGLVINQVYIMHLNKDYTLDKSLDLKGFFLIEDKTDEAIKSFLMVEHNVDELNQVLNNKIEPKSNCGSHCTMPHQCEFYQYCHKEYNKDSIDNLSRLSSQKKFELDKLKVKYIKDIPATFPLTERQSIQRKCAISNTFHVESHAITKKLKEIQYPAFYLDFEATNRAIPCFQGMKPNQFLVYQASIHKQEKSNDSTLSHTEFLHTQKTDPRMELINYLLNNLGTKGSIIVWNKSFEASRLKELAIQFPEYSEKILSLVNRFYDLADIFSQNLCYHHNMCGSASIKYVLSVMDPHFSYDRLIIKNGTDSQAHYIKMIAGKYKGGMYHKMKKALLEYNKLDTLAMFVIKQNLESKKYLDFTA